MGFRTVLRVSMINQGLAHIKNTLLLVFQRDKRLRRLLSNAKSDIPAVKQSCQP